MTDDAPSRVGATQADLYGTRYGELFFGTVDGGTVTAEVWTTFTLNDCPAELWDALDVDALAAARGATFGRKNGPRYWLIDSLERGVDGEEVVQDRFGQLDLLRVATLRVDLSTVGSGGYRPSAVDRRTVFTWRTGRRVQELVDPEGAVYVMQSYSQIVDPDLTEAGLASLGERLRPPDGWLFRRRVLGADLVVDTRTTDARVLQDELQNSYCRWRAPGVGAASGAIAAGG